MTPTELKHMRTLLKVIKKEAVKYKVRTIEQTADAGLQILKNIASDATNPALKLLKIIPMNEIKPFVKR